MTRPAITNIFHADFTPVSAASPARAGETLITIATGLGPVTPQANLGSAFPASTIHTVAAPVTVNVNGARRMLLIGSAGPVWSIRTASISRCPGPLGMPTSN